MLSKIFDRIRTHFEHRRLIVSLRGLSDRELADIGIRRDDITAAVAGRLGQASYEQPTASHPVATKVRQAVTQTVTVRNDNAPHRTAA